MVIHYLLFKLFVKNMAKKLAIEPLHSNVLIKPLSAEEVTASGIVLPDTVDQDKPMEGEVMAVGPGKRDENGERMPMDVKKGDRVLFTKYAPDEVEVDGEEYLVVEEDKILGIIQN